MTRQKKSPVKSKRITFDIIKFREILIHWFKSNARSLPWRKAEHWYPIFLSEFLLQQTQVKQALPYYHKFVNVYPSIADLAQAEEQDVLRLWAGLGYYSRAKNLLKAAKEINYKHKNEFPQKFDDALKLPGIGNYTASAILSIAFDKPHAVVDGNVIRVISRLFAIKENIRDTQTIKLISKLCHRLLDQNQPGLLNEALMETGALICKPQNPLCSKCALLGFCRTGKSTHWQRIPFKSTPPAKKEKHEIVFLIKNGDKILLAQRSESRLLASMWEFPAINADEYSDEANAALRSNINKNEIKRSPNFKHTYTHIQLHYYAILMACEFKSFIKLLNWESRYSQIKSIEISKIDLYPIHNAHRKLIDWYLKAKTE